MKISRRAIGLILFVSIILLLGTLFWSFILEKIIQPLSLAAWVLLRIFVLSIDQRYYWGAIIFAVAIFLFRLLPQDQTAVQSENFIESNATIRTIEYWRILFNLTGGRIQDEETLKRELIHLLLSLYASKQRTSTNFKLYDSMHRGEVPLPEHIHTFLFPAEPEKSKRPLQKIMQSVRNAPRRWFQRWTGRETAECYRMIDEILCFMEKSMEIKNDDGKLTQNKR